MILTKTKTMSSYFEALDLALPSNTVEEKVRNEVLSRVPWTPTPTTRVSYVASNRVLIIASLEKAQQVESRLDKKLVSYIAIPAERSGLAAVSNAWKVRNLSLNGYLGKFHAMIDSDGGNATDSELNNLGKILNIENGLFDHIIDGSDEPLLTAAVKPPGYYYIGRANQDTSSGTDDGKYDPALELAVESIPDFIGEFEKPRFFDYNPDICAHGRSGIPGCTRCLDACPTEAIISIGDQIEINPHLCQGGGTCASSCPSGAIAYVYPKSEEQLKLLRQLTREMRISLQTTANQPLGITCLIFDNENGREKIEDELECLPKNIVPLVVEEIGSVGLDFMSCALAYGINRLYLYVPVNTPKQVRDTLWKHQNLMMNVIDQLGLEGYSIEMVEDITNLRDIVTDNIVVDEAARFAAVGNKRSTIRSALSHLNEISGKAKEVISLQSGALFGRINVALDSCTLCMGCVSVCPGNALAAGGDSPALKFVEANCLQCGICARACPETAIELEPRLHFDINVVNKMVTLKEESPFLCVSCSKPFATKAMIAKMTEKLQGHWMFDNPEAFKRLQMCEDCRVVDMFDKKDMIG